jgi:hypothetical protein
VTAAGTLGKTTTEGSLWLYTRNDQFFTPELSRRMYQAYRDSGGPATYHLLPAIGEGGHGLIGPKDGLPLWEDRPRPSFARSASAPPPLTAVVGFAA